MALIRVHIHLLPPTTSLRFTKFHIHPSLHYVENQPKVRTFCSNSNLNSINDMELGMDSATEMERMNAQIVQTREAMKTSRKLLYAELCSYLGLGKEDLKRKWDTMEEEDKWVLVEEFVSDWGSNFHPLSARSVKELIDQHLFHDDDDDRNGNEHDSNSSQDSSSSSSTLFGGLKKLVGFPRWDF